jgi:hypothetical protein
MWNTINDLIFLTRLYVDDQSESDGFGFFVLFIIILFVLFLRSANEENN